MTYTIQKGDTLSKIASANGTTVNDLMALNPNITNANKIYAGGTLNLSASEQAAQTATVRATGTTGTTASTGVSTGNVYDQQLAMLKENQAQQTTWMSEAKKVQEDSVLANKESAVAEINRQKSEQDKTLQKTKTGAYTDWMKSINPYGVNRESAVSQGLGGAGYSETTQANYFNSYQTTVSAAIESTNKIKADYDAHINQAILSANSELAEIAANNYQQQITAMWDSYQTELDILNNQVSYNQWETEFNYQKEQDKISNSKSGGGSKDKPLSLDEPVGTSPKYGVVTAALKSQQIPLMNKENAKKAQMNIISKAFNNGDITKAEMLALSEQYGL